MSKEQTLLHIRRVQQLLGDAVVNLTRRAALHDASKLESPEAEAFDRATHLLRSLTYGSPEYEKVRTVDLKEALEHHYANNRHHPEHWPEGVRGMTLLDLIEMVLDWKAGTERHADGDIRRSIEINQKRFGYSDELKAIFLNTIAEMGL